jgi:hypothetical protein
LKGRIPKTITLPFGYRIRVLQVPKRELDDCYADWCCTTRTIRVQKSLSLARRRYLVAHELLHALNDFTHALLLHGLAQNTSAGD